MYFEILATYFWLDLYVLTDFFRTCKHPSPEYSKYFRCTKNMYVCERLLEQIRHILYTPVTMPKTKISTGYAQKSPRPLVISRTQPVHLQRTAGSSWTYVYII